MSDSLAIPGPRPGPYLGNFLPYIRDPLGYQLRLVQDVGPVVQYRLGSQDLVLLTDPAAVREMYAAGSECLVKGYALQTARRVVGEGLLTSEGKVHKRARRMLAPIFQPNKVGRYAPLMAAAAEHHASGWRAGQVRDVAEDMGELTLEIIARILFDRDIDGETGRIGVAFAHALKMIARLTFPPYRRLERLPLPSHVRFRRALRYLDALVYRLIEKRRRGGRQSDDLLSWLMSVEDERGEVLTDREVRDEVMTLFFAGHETTANGMAWTFELLGRHPACEQRLADEIRGALGGRAPTLADLERLPYARQVILEALRLKPTVYNTTRLAVSDVHVAGYHIPAGTVLIASPYVSHRQAAFFDDPELFRPDRWAQQDPRRSHRHQYFPFGGGRRICIGEHFSILEMTMILAAVVSRWRLEPTGESEVRGQPMITLRPWGGLPMRVFAQS